MFKVLKALLAGLLAGASLGLLFSPKKGEELRKNIKDEVKSGGSGLKTVKEAATNFAKDLKTSVEEAYEKVPEEHKTKAKNAVKKVKHEVKKAHKDIKKNLKKKK